MKLHSECYERDKNTLLPIIVLCVDTIQQNKKESIRKVEAKQKLLKKIDVGTHGPLSNWLRKECPLIIIITVPSKISPNHFRKNKHRELNN